METNKSCLPLFIVQPVIWPITHYSACNFSINTAQLAEPAEHQRMWSKPAPYTHTHTSGHKNEQLCPTLFLMFPLIRMLMQHILHSCVSWHTPTMFSPCTNLNTVIASSSVTKWSNYVFKHGQCRVLIDSKDLGCIYSGSPIGGAHLNKPHTVTTYTAGNLIWHVIMQPETTRSALNVGNAVFSLIKDWSAILIVHDKAVARNLPLFFCCFHPLFLSMHCGGLIHVYKCTHSGMHTCTDVWVHVCAASPCQTPLLSVM